MVETFIIVITTLLITPCSFTTHTLAIFRVIEADLSILNPNCKNCHHIDSCPSIHQHLRNINPLHYTSTIRSHSRSTTMAFKYVRTFGTLHVNNPFIDSLQIDGTITTNSLMVMSTFCDPTSFISSIKCT
jgi:hypothetical protein